MTAYRVFSPEQAYEETLDYAREIDGEVGTRISAVLQAAVSLESRLSTVDLYTFGEEDEAEGGLPTAPSLLASANLGVIQVRFNVEKDYTNLFGDEGVLRNRFLPHKQHVIRSVGTISNASILDICVAHELGHGAFLYKLADKYGDDNVGERYDHHTRYDKRTLPLALPSSQALEYWTRNNGGYRAYLQSVGYNESVFANMLDANVRAYNRLPMEAVADGFALDIIRYVYKVD